MQSQMQAQNPGVVIVGAGMAAYTVARELRKLNKDIPLTILSADGGGFYSKPMLSNAFAQNKEAQQLVSQTAQQMATQLQAEVKSGVTVQAIDRANKTLHTSGGEIAYDKLVLALGAQQVKLKLEGDAAEQVFSVNHIDEYAQLRSKLTAFADGARVVILGAGLIGCEFADDLSGAGHKVSLVDLNPLPMALLAHASLGQGLQNALQNKGVQFYLGTSARAVQAEQQGLRLELADGRSIEADLIMSAVGLRPEIALAQNAGLHCERGICVDAHGLSSDPDIFALGDCAQYALADGVSQVMPYVAPIMAAGRAIARSLNGELTAIEHKPAPVIVKTPSYPLALLPVLPGAAGNWQVEQQDGRTVARFCDEQQVLRGFGIAPQEAQLRQSLLAQIGKAA